jgi:5-formyltetrahydrofolate cyclo-ligase
MTSKNKYEELLASKKDIRSRMQVWRNSLTEDEIESKSAKVVESLLKLPAVREAETVMAYYEYRSEVRTFRLLQEILDAGKNLVLPASDFEEHRIIPCLVKDIEKDLILHGQLGIMEPDPNTAEIIDIRKIDLILVPGLVFDKAGNRIGYGKGYYDRFLSRYNGQSPRTIGLAFDEQIIDSIPTLEHDARLNGIVTDLTVYNCN